MLPKTQKDVFFKLSNQGWISKFYLAGGTALALQIGHRESVDFDFFTEEEINNNSIINYIEEIGNFEIVDSSKNTIIGEIDDVRISFMTYTYPIISNFTRYNNINICGLSDIATMKIAAISQRCTKKDFIDLFFLLRYFTLEEMLNLYRKKYGTRNENDHHIFKSLTYFIDADEDPLPTMNEQIDWNEVKKHILIKTREIQDKIF